MQLLLEETEACEGSLCQSRISDQVRISPFKGCAAIVTTAKKRERLKTAGMWVSFHLLHLELLFLDIIDIFHTGLSWTKWWTWKRQAMHVWLSVYLKKFIEHQASCVFKHKTKHLNSTSKVGLWRVMWHLFHILNWAANSLINWPRLSGKKE